MPGKKIACLFPGIGYTCDKPLLYYSGKLLKELGWEVVPVPYSGFPSGAKGNPEKMQQCADIALEQAETLLREIRWNEYAEILFIGKSVGTVACAAFARKHRIPCRQILFTPVEATFHFAGGRSVVLHGTADPWAETGKIEACCRKMNIPIHEVSGANHSLETGNVETDLEILRTAVRIVRDFAGSRACPE